MSDKFDPGHYALLSGPGSESGIGIETLFPFWSGGRGWLGTTPWLSRLLDNNVFSLSPAAHIAP